MFYLFWLELIFEPPTFQMEDDKMQRRRRLYTAHRGGDASPHSTFTQKHEKPSNVSCRVIASLHDEANIREIDTFTEIKTHPCPLLYLRAENSPTQLAWRSSVAHHCRARRAPPSTLPSILKRALAHKPNGKREQFPLASLKQASLYIHA